MPTKHTFAADKTINRHGSLQEELRPVCSMPPGCLHHLAASDARQPDKVKKKAGLNTSPS